MTDLTITILSIIGIITGVLFGLLNLFKNKKQKLEINNLSSTIKDRDQTISIMKKAEAERNKYNQAFNKSFFNDTIIELRKFARDRGQTISIDRDQTISMKKAEAERNKYNQAFDKSSFNDTIIELRKFARERNSINRK